MPAAAPEPERSAAAASTPTETQRRLVDAALDVFAERGYEGATTAQIAARAGVAEKTLFANFGSKERLYQATLEPAAILATMLPEAIRTLAPVFASPPDDLRALLGAIFANRADFAANHRRQVRLLAQHLVMRPESVIALTGAFHERIAPVAVPLIEHLVAKGAVRGDVPPLTLIRILATSLVGYLLTRTVFRPDLAWDDNLEIDHMIRVLTEGMVPRRPKGAAPAKPRRPRAR